jgi:Undecaprenyl-phosphate glucose phosphotransferase
MKAATDLLKVIRAPRASADAGWALSADSLGLFVDVLKLVETATLLGAGYGCFLASGHPDAPSFWSDYGSSTLIACLLFPFVLERTHAYRADRLHDRVYLCRAAALGCVILFGGLLLLGYVTNSLNYFSRTWVLLWFLATVAALFAWRVALAVYLHTLRATGHLRERIAIVGTGPVCDMLVDYLGRQQIVPVDIVGIFDTRHARATVATHPVDGSLDDLMAVSRAGKVDKIVLALPWSAEEHLLEIVGVLKELAVDIALAPDRIGFSLMHRRVDHLGELPLVAVVDRPLSQWRYVTKLVEDKVVAGLALIMLSPVLALVALAVRLDSPGPVLFRQPRQGFDNLAFSVFKFRTMRWEARDVSGAQQTGRNDPRITRIGGFLRKTSLDELPQLLNVLRGEMSIVGPRPHPVGMRTQDRLCEDIVKAYAYRHRVRPGITGLAQIKGYRGATETPTQLQRRVQFDLFYIDHWSVWLDLKIMVLTVLTVLGRRNAF